MHELCLAGTTPRGLILEVCVACFSTAFHADFPAQSPFTSVAAAAASILPFGLAESFLGAFVESRVGERFHSMSRVANITCCPVVRKLRCLSVLIS